MGKAAALRAAPTARAPSGVLQRETELGGALPYARHVSDYVVALDSRALMICFKLDGASFETADVRDINDWHAKLNNAWRNLADERYVSNFSAVTDAQAPSVSKAVFFPGEGRSVFGGVTWAF